MLSRQKNILLTITYFTLATITIGFSILFMIFLSTQATALYQQIMYYILSSLVVLLVALDIIFTVIKSNKFVSGILIFVLAIATIIMGCVLYLLMQNNFAIPTSNLFSYIGMMALSYLTITMLIVMFCVGESLITNSTKTLRKKSIND